ncbi:MAG: hypothetical protein BWY09_02474 [Candidatus Hydrogenedentes bacterium ADurb.Bin179]|nr:MAG: hypothetical protein BWY09_02474 [Candidatus Hydrogenedentes bacterium ADurb.Bin179]
MIDIDTSSKTEQRKFGLVMAAAFAILGLLRTAIRFALHGTFANPAWFFVVAAPFLVLGLLWPKGLKPLFVVWIKLALVLNWIVTHVLLTVVFFLIIVPMGILMRLFSDDPLKRKWLPQANSYWEEPEEQPEAFDRYLNQF